MVRSGSGIIDFLKILGRNPIGKKVAESCIAPFQLAPVVTVLIFLFQRIKGKIKGNDKSNFIRKHIFPKVRQSVVRTKLFVNGQCFVARYMQRSQQLD